MCLQFLNPFFWLEQMYPEIEDQNRQKVLRFIQVH